MTNRETSRFQRALEIKRSELAKGIGFHTARLTIGDAEHDPIDRVLSMNRREEAVTMIAQLTRTLWDVEASLLAISEGCYGLCVECEETIGLKRLQAIPWATHCIACQQFLESREADRRAA